jgi:hypothetical protein
MRPVHCQMHCCSAELLRHLFHLNCNIQWAALCWLHMWPCLTNVCCCGNILEHVRLQGGSMVLRNCLC